MRWKTNQYDDRRFFRRTASSTKAINLSARIMRGGIRL